MEGWRQTGHISEAYHISQAPARAPPGPFRARNLTRPAGPARRKGRARRGRHALLCWLGECADCAALAQQIPSPEPSRGKGDAEEAATRRRRTRRRRRPSGRAGPDHVRVRVRALPARRGAAVPAAVLLLRVREDGRPARAAGARLAAPRLPELLPRTPRGLFPSSSCCFSAAAAAAPARAVLLLRVRGHGGPARAAARPALLAAPRLPELLPRIPRGEPPSVAAAAAAALPRLRLRLILLLRALRRPRRRRRRRRPRVRARVPPPLRQRRAPRRGLRRRLGRGRRHVRAPGPPPPPPRRGGRLRRRTPPAARPAPGPRRRQGRGAPRPGRVHRRAAHGRGGRARRRLRHLQGGPAPRLPGAEAPLRPPLPLLLHRHLARDAQLLPRLPLPHPVRLRGGGRAGGAGLGAHADHHPLNDRHPPPQPRARWCGGGCSGLGLAHAARAGCHRGRSWWTCQ
ncbi:hypothetical protein PVAP13_6KG293806 [Panicum virgatum]|uniref:Uncharacterized protein n=1 Tax=Panicum virgatum TaxID=38727 RepID=A0A8T0REF2_PANVG|nr:hypothetical protein PVAP13_6KG293806 [Panicum virgatum]